MSVTIRRVVSSAVCLSLFLVGSAFAQSDPQVGVWKLNVAKSKYSPGPVPNSATTTIEAVGAGTKVVVDQTMADGTARHWEFTANYDGKDSPVTGNPDVDTVARTRLNGTTVQTISKKAGKVVTTQTSAVSSDGKTRTVTTKGVNASGQQIHNVAIYEKQ
jgi:hypothetical protein